MSSLTKQARCLLKPSGSVRICGTFCVANMIGVSCSIDVATTEGPHSSSDVDVDVNLVGAGINFFRSFKSPRGKHLSILSLLLALYVPLPCHETHLLVQEELPLQECRYFGAGRSTTYFQAQYRVFMLSLLQLQKLFLAIAAPWSYSMSPHRLHRRAFPAACADTLYNLAVRGHHCASSET